MRIEARMSLKFCHFLYRRLLGGLSKKVESSSEPRTLCRSRFHKYLNKNKKNFAVRPSNFQILVSALTGLSDNRNPNLGIKNFESFWIKGNSILVCFFDAITVSEGKLISPLPRLHNLCVRPSLSQVSHQTGTFEFIKLLPWNCEVRASQPLPHGSAKVRPIFSKASRRLGAVSQSVASPLLSMSNLRMKAKALVVRYAQPLTRRIIYYERSPASESLELQHSARHTDSCS